MRSSQALVMWTEPRSDAPDVIETLELAGCHVLLGHDQRRRDDPITEADLLEVVGGLHGLMVGGRERITRRVLEAGEHLLVVSKRGIGVDKIDVEAATELGIMVTNTPVEDHRTAVAEYGVSLAFGIAKRLQHGDRLVRRGGFEQMRITLLSGKTAGIIGYGQVGRRAAAMLRALGMQVLSYDPYAPPDETSVSLEELLSRADLVSLHAALTDENHHLIDERALRTMKPDALLVNTARGGLVKEAALAEAIRSGRLGGAALNVFEVEPPPPDSPILADDIADRVLVTPHGAGQGVPEIHERMPRAQAAFHLAALRGEEPTSHIVSPVVNPEVLVHWRGRRWAPLAGG